MTKWSVLLGSLLCRSVFCGMMQHITWTRMVWFYLTKKKTTSSERHIASGGPESFPGEIEEEWLSIAHLFETCASTNFWDKSCFTAAGVVGFFCLSLFGWLVLGIFVFFVLFFPPQNISLHFPSPFCVFLMFTSFPFAACEHSGS